MKICLDAGHGGSDPGAVANGYIEKYLNLPLVFEFKKELERCGIQTVLTRNSDVYVSLYERGRMAIDEKCDLLISCHFNFYNSQAKGFEAIYSLGSEISKNTANCIIDEVVKLGIYRRGVWTKESQSNPGHNWYGVLRHSEPLPAIIVEGLFLDNTRDVEFLKQPDFLKNLAAAYTVGICKAYKIPYVAASIEKEPDGPIPKGKQPPDESPQWKKLGAQYLKDAGYTQDLHRADEIVDMGVLGVILKNRDMQGNNKSGSQDGGTQQTQEETQSNTDA